MNQRLLIIGGGAVGVLLIIVLVIMALIPRQQATDGDPYFNYTDSITGLPSTALPKKTDISESGHHTEQEIGEVSIAGIDSFYEKIGQDAAQIVQQTLSQYLRARGGTGSIHAAVQGASVSEISLAPASYSFSLVGLRPEATYKVTVTIPVEPPQIPVVDIQEVIL